MVGSILRDISLQERQERVSFGRSRSSSTGVDSGGGRSGSVALCWANSEVRSVGKAQEIRKNLELVLRLVVVGCGSVGGHDPVRAGSWALSPLRYESRARSVRDETVKLRDSSARDHHSAPPD